VNLRQHGLPELLFIGTQTDGPSAAERWPLVKALDQFGTLDHVRATKSRGMPSVVPPIFPTFDLSRATYRSHYLAFVHKDMLDASGHLYQRLSKQEQAIYVRYARAANEPFKNDPNRVLATAIFGNLPASTRRFPIVVVGEYLETYSQDVRESDFTQQTPAPGGTPGIDFKTEGLPFSAVQDAMIQNKDPSGTRVVEDVNAEANIITALICHMDGRRPAQVCNRQGIKAILKHVK
jgi:hypothetical protein